MRDQLRDREVALATLEYEATALRTSSSCLTESLDAARSDGVTLHQDYVIEHARMQASLSSALRSVEVCDRSIDRSMYM